MTNELIFNKAVRLLETSHTLALSVIDEKGYPKVYAMEKVATDNLNEVLFITKKDSNKVRCLERNNKCCIEVHTEDDMICLVGKMTIETNEEKIKPLLSEAYLKRLAHSGFHKYCLLIFHTEQINLYIDGIQENR